QVAVVVLARGGLSVCAWRNGRFIDVALPNRPDAMRPRDVVGSLVDAVGQAVGESVGLHLVFVHPPDPLGVPRRWRRGLFHRIVYVTPEWELDDIPPTALLCLLRKDLWIPVKPRRVGHTLVDHEGPYFSSFIPTVIRSPTRPWWRSLYPQHPPGLSTLKLLPIADNADFTTRETPGKPIAPRWRFHRDLCRLRPELPQLR